MTSRSDQTLRPVHAGSIAYQSRPRRLDLTGVQFGELVVLRRAKVGEYVLCRCAAGHEVSVAVQYLRQCERKGRPARCPKCREEKRE